MGTTEAKYRRDIVYWDWEKSIRPEERWRACVSSTLGLWMRDILQCRHLLIMHYKKKTLLWKHPKIASIYFRSLAEIVLSSKSAGVCHRLVNINLREHSTTFPSFRTNLRGRSSNATHSFYSVQFVSLWGIWNTETVTIDCTVTAVGRHTRTNRCAYEWLVKITKHPSWYWYFHNHHGHASW